MYLVWFGDSQETIQGKNNILYKIRFSPKIMA